MPLRIHGVLASHLPIHLINSKLDHHMHLLQNLNLEVRKREREEKERNKERRESQACKGGWSGSERIPGFVENRRLLRA